MIADFVCRGEDGAGGGEDEVFFGGEVNPEGVGEFAGKGGRVEGVGGEVDADLMDELDE